MERPRPVPPYLRAVVPSAWANDSNIRFLQVPGDPDAGVADDELDDGVGSSRGRRSRDPSRPRPGPSGPSPCRCSVNLKALASRFLSTCRRRPESVTSIRRHARQDLDAEGRRSSARPRRRKSRSSAPCNSGTGSSPSWSVTVPDSTFARSRMSSSSRSRSRPDEWITPAYWTCVSVRFSSGLSSSSRARISRLLSGVRSSCDMLEKNSDLYMFCSTRAVACLPRSSFELRSSSCRACSSCACDCERASSVSVRVLASIVLSTSPMFSVSCSRNT